MADANFRASVAIQDDYSGPLSKFRSALGGVREEGNKTGAALRKDFEGFNGALGRSTGALQQMPALLSRVGLGSAGAALSIGGMATALSRFSGNTAALSRMSAETGLAIDRLRAFGALGERFGVSASTMQGGVQKFAVEMDSLKRRIGETYGALYDMNLGSLAEKLVRSPNMEASLNAVMEELGRINNPARRRKLAELFFGVGEMGAVAAEVGGKYQQLMEEIERRLGHTTQKQIEAAKRFEQSLSDLRQNFDDLGNQSLTPVLEKLNEFVTALRSPEAEKLLKGAVDYMANRVTGMMNEIKFIMETYEKLKGYMGSAAAGAPSVSGAPLAPSGPLGPGKPGAAIENSLRSAQQKLGEFYRSGEKDAGREKELTGEIRRLTEELRKVREQGGASASPSAFNAPSDGAAKIFNAGYGGGAILWGGRGALNRGGGGALPGGSDGALSGYRGALPGGGSTGEDHSVAPMPGMPRPSVPAISGGGALSPRGTASLFDQSLPGERRGANPGAYRDVLDHIARSEGTAGKPGGGYNTSLDYGRWLPGGQEVDLRGKTLDEIDALQTHMLNQPGNRARYGNGLGSSAIGRYQIVRKTLRGLRRNLRLNGSEIYDDAMQDRLAAELARARGPNVSLGDEWASLRGQRLSTAIDLMGRVDRSASTIPTGRGSDGAATADTPGAGDRAGDAMMRRLYGNQAPVARMPTQHHSMSIDVTGLPFGAKTRVQMSDMFNEVSVAKGRQADGESI